MNTINYEVIDPDSDFDVTADIPCNTTDQLDVIFGL